ncbi:MAG: NUDIX domain-containing protein [Sedimentisphaerales bacterium]|nr:NUDIX domain-containing protein [Sedimentisphaerales bacterium]MBN2842750.1 NUDIX domain-containing protein [Sedimentisphaerales bacterium]
MENTQNIIQRLNFTYCPKCSSQNLISRGNKAISCKDCDYILYQNNAAAVAVFIRQEDKIVLTRRARDPQKGMLDTPGGFVDPFESLEEALHREIKEELNLQLTEVKYLTSAPNIYHYRGVTYLTTDCFFTARAIDFNQIKAADDVCDYILIKPADINPELVAFESVRSVLKQNLL